MCETLHDFATSLSVSLLVHATRRAAQKTKSGDLYILVLSSACWCRPG